MRQKYLTDIKELAPTKTESYFPTCSLCQGQKVALEHTATTAADCLLAPTFCCCMKG